MSLWLDEKYLRFLSPQLERFTQKQAHTYNFRCPLCGDSDRIQSKTRGYVYAKGQQLMFKCHNCSIALPFVALLRRMSRHLYDQYLLEKLKDERPVERAPEREVPAIQEIKRGAELPILTLFSSSTHALHDVYLYAKNRGLNDDALARLSATNKAYSWLLPLVGEDKAKKVADGLNYLVLPMCLPDGTWYGAQLRMASRKEYITFRWSHEPLKVFGLNAVDPQRSVYIVEGPVDALCLPNAIAACGSDLIGAWQHVEQMCPEFRQAERIYVWDNEPRNKEVVRHLRDAIRLREKVVIWPKSFPKDINDAVLEGIEVESLVRTRTFSGLMSELEFESWKK